MRASLLLFLLCLNSFLFAAFPEPVRSEHGMVSSPSRLASAAGVEMFKAGGNAIDAAVAVGFALAVTRPSAGNLAGGGFMVLMLEDGSATTLDSRETAPLAATRTMFQDEEGNVVKGLSTSSHKASGVPGTVDGYLRALEKHGTLTRQQVLAPAIRLARAGFPLTHELAQQFESRMRYFKEYPATMAVFSKNGELYQAGDLWQQSDLANTLERIAKEGRAGFYEGETAKLIVAEMERGGGLISHRDLQNYASVWREPVRGSYRDHDIISMPPPSSGGIMIVHILNMLEPYDLAQMGWGSSQLIHHIIEAERRAYADRAKHLGDPDFWQNPMKMLLSKEYAKHRFSTFDPQKAGNSTDFDAGLWPVESPETTHFSVMDKKGNAVSCTTTLNTSFGNKIVVPGTGFLLNNEMDDFSSKPGVPNIYGLVGSEANAIEPKKRMLSSMTPAIVAKDGKALLVTGSPGGSTIISTVLQVIMNIVDHKMTLSQAVNLPRFHHQWKPDQVIYEKFSFSPDTEAALRALGHRELKPTRWRLGGAHSILYRDGVFHGVADLRRGDGTAVGY